MENIIEVDGWSLRRIVYYLSNGVIRAIQGLNILVGRVDDIEAVTGTSFEDLINLTLRVENLERAMGNLKADLNLANRLNDEYRVLLDRQDAVCVAMVDMVNEPVA